MQNTTFQIQTDIICNYNDIKTSSDAIKSFTATENKIISMDIEFNKLSNAEKFNGTILVYQTSQGSWGGKPILIDISFQISERLISHNFADLETLKQIKNDYNTYTEDQRTILRNCCYRVFNRDSFSESIIPLHQKDEKCSTMETLHKKNSYIQN